MLGYPLLKYGNTAVGESIDIDTFLRSGHAVVRLGQPSLPSLAESHLDALGLARRTCMTTHHFSSLIRWSSVPG